MLEKSAGNTRRIQASDLWSAKCLPLRVRYWLRQLNTVPILVVFIAVGACSKPPAAIDAPVKASFVEPLVTELPQYLSFSATTAPRRSVDIVARTRGFIDEVTFSDGQAVKKGQLLYRLETVVNQADFDEATANQLIAKAQVAETRLEFERYKRLVKLGSAAQEALDSAKLNYQTALGNLDAAAASLEKIRQDLTYTEVKAPFNGIMSRTLYYPGQLVGEASPDSDTRLTTLAQVNPLYVYFDVPSKHLLTVLQAQQHSGPLPLLFSTQAKPYVESVGHLDFIDKGVNPSTGTIEMRGLIGNTSMTIYPGQAGRLRLQTNKLSDAVLVPSEVLLLDGEGSFVWVVGSDGKIRRQGVQRFDSVGEWTRITGVAPKQKVVASRLATLKAGHQIKPYQKHFPPPTIFHIGKPAETPTGEQTTRPRAPEPATEAR